MNITPINILKYFTAIYIINTRKATNKLLHKKPIYLLLTSLPIIYISIGFFPGGYLFKTLRKELDFFI